MKQIFLKSLLFTLLLSSCGKQTSALEEENMISGYDVLHRDTIVLNHFEGVKGDDNYRAWTSQKIQADVIVYNIPLDYDSVKFNSELKKILSAEHLNTAYVFRDATSSLLFKMSFMEAHSMIKSRNGYLGQIEVEEANIDGPSNLGECFEALEEYNVSNEYEFVKLNIYKKKNDSTFYFPTCDYNGSVYLTQLSQSIDVASLEDLGEFWTDKHAVFYEYQTSDGVKLYRLESADRKTFRSFGKSVYARDKDHIFDSRHGIIKDADLESFQPIAVDKETGISVYGKDKYSYFFWDEKVKDTVEFKKLLKID